MWVEVAALPIQPSQASRITRVRGVYGVMSRRPIVHVQPVEHRSVLLLHRPPRV